ncbi:uncharacterized protein K441DRAFT_678587 [Cenococcum geophilum 1.58]|uniref:uncharacterized protein n=1 Tax=Cenococcum geophilum 1.58 TaxID=794803 RepID=UPI00358EB99F|nr:hypothetical protein K441DRAFT_678587 [Cenococcum geophilum 1.58]
MRVNIQDTGLWFLQSDIFATWKRRQNFFLWLYGIPGCDKQTLKKQAKGVWIVLDALDECRTRKGLPAEGLLLWTKELLNSEQRNVHLLVTSRQEQDITSGVTELAYIDDIVPIESDLITDDIRAYVRTRVSEDEGFKRWRARPDVQEEIETQLIEKADGM